MKEICDLDIYRLAEGLSDMIWEGFDLWPEKVWRTVGYPVIRSADSIAANLAQGYGRYSPGDRKVFYRCARGSFEGTKAWLGKLIRRKVLEEEEVPKYTDIVNELGPKLNAFLNSTQ
jgi:four helix bundle protein